MRERHAVTVSTTIAITIEMLCCQVDNFLGAGCDANSEPLLKMMTMMMVTTTTIMFVYTRSVLTDRAAVQALPTPYVEHSALH